MLHLPTGGFQSLSTLGSARVFPGWRRIPCQRLTDLFCLDTAQNGNLLDHLASVEEENTQFSPLI